MALHLHDGGHHIALLDDLGNLGLVEVRYADGAQLAGLVGGLKLAVAGDEVAGGLVQNHQVDVVDAQALKRFVNGGVAFVEARPQLRFQENFLARLARRLHAAADGFFVHVGVGGVNQLVAVRQRALHGGLRVVGLQHERAQAQDRYLHLVVKRDVFHAQSFRKLK